MTGAEYIVNCIKRYGVTDVFGIPGACVLELMYAFERDEKIKIHLSFHEQAAAFEACGYAQASGKVGVAYVTKGPGITNAITAVADAFFDSIPLVLISAHTSDLVDGMRFFTNQELDSVALTSSVTKMSIRIDTKKDLIDKFEEVLNTALCNRKGPVFVDINTNVLAEELLQSEKMLMPKTHSCSTDILDISKYIVNNLKKAKRPVFLIGAGLDKESSQYLSLFAEKHRIPILSSRKAQGILNSSDMYYGYIGSRGARYSNFILEKSDLIVSLGNRLAFSTKSESFNKFFIDKKVIRCDVDENEFCRSHLNSTDYLCDCSLLVKTLESFGYVCETNKEWENICNRIKKQLFEVDVSITIKSLSKLLCGVPREATLFADVGNNAIWLSRAYEFSNITNEIYYSMNFSTLGSSICKAIGAYYATSLPAIAFIGDQGLQFNIQELEFFRNNCIPVCIIVINNFSSGMIKASEKKYKQDLHVTKSSGYTCPSIETIANCYGLMYCKWMEGMDVSEVFRNINSPQMVELQVDEEDIFMPQLPLGNDITKMWPLIDNEDYKRLKEL